LALQTGGVIVPTCRLGYLPRLPTTSPTKSTVYFNQIIAFFRTLPQVRSIAKLPVVFNFCIAKHCHVSLAACALLAFLVLIHAVASGDVFQ